MKEFQAIAKQVQQKNFKPIYLLMGDEPYFIDKLAHYIQKQALTEEERSFNEIVLYGKDVDAQAIVNEAKRYPMMAERVLVVVREAQDLRKWDALEAYAENPQPSTVLVLAHKYKKIDKRKKLYKLLQKNHVVLESKKMYDNQIPPWIDQQVKNRKCSITPKANQLLLESLGNDLGKIDMELDKLLLVVPPGSEINDQTIEENIGISKDFNNFELQKALRDKDLPRALMIQKYFAANTKSHPLVLTLTVVFNFFSKLMLAHQAKDKSDAGLARTLKVNPYFASDYSTGMRHYSLRKCAQTISDLRECDRRAKGVENNMVSDGELLRELIYKIICTWF